MKKIFLATALVFSPIVSASEWATTTLIDEFTGQKSEMTGTVVKNGQSMVIMCGSSPRGGDYQPFIAFANHNKRSKTFDSELVKWRVDDNKGVSRMMWQKDGHYHGLTWGNEGQEAKDVTDLMVKQFKGGNSVIISVNGGETTRFSLSGFTRAFNYVETQCETTYREKNNYFKGKAKLVVN